MSCCVFCFVSIQCVPEIRNSCAIALSRGKAYLVHTCLIEHLHTYMCEFKCWTQAWTRLMRLSTAVSASVVRLPCDKGVVTASHALRCPFCPLPGTEPSCRPLTCAVDMGGVRYADGLGCALPGLLGSEPCSALSRADDMGLLALFRAPGVVKRVSPGSRVDAFAALQACTLIVSDRYTSHLQCTSQASQARQQRAGIKQLPE